MEISTYVRVQVNNDGQPSLHDDASHRWVEKRKEVKKERKRETLQLD
jgi:hypothetical protein